jgi:hypothetical protein
MFDSLPHPAIGQVVVDHAAGLHRRVDGRRTNEPEARLLQALRQGRRLRGRGLPVPLAGRWRVPGRGEAPEELLERLGVTEGDGGAGVRDRRLDLPAMADDRCIRHKPLDIALAERGDAIRVEPLEGGAKAFTLAQDRQPAEAGLEALEAEPLVEPALVADGASPLLIVVGDVERVGGRPAANQVYGSSTSTWTIPSSTVTG